jgi:hypothetical protein
MTKSRMCVLVYLNIKTFCCGRNEGAERIVETTCVLSRYWYTSKHVAVVHFFGMQKAVHLRRANADVAALTTAMRSSKSDMNLCTISRATSLGGFVISMKFLQKFCSSARNADARLSFILSTKFS